MKLVRFAFYGLLRNGESLDFFVPKPARRYKSSFNGFKVIEKNGKYKAVPSSIDSVVNCEICEFEYGFFRRVFLFFVLDVVESVWIGRYKRCEVETKHGKAFVYIFNWKV